MPMVNVSCEFIQRQFNSQSPNTCSMPSAQKNAAICDNLYISNLHISLLLFLLKSRDERNQVREKRAHLRFNFVYFSRLRASQSFISIIIMTFTVYTEWCVGEKKTVDLLLCVCLFFVFNFTQQLLIAWKMCISWRWMRRICYCLFLLSLFKMQIRHHYNYYYFYHCW